jgi:hypothetical protein
MNGLRKFKALDPNRHNPAIGSCYGKEPSLGRLLIVGMSHYGGEHVRLAKFTHDIVGEVINCERRISYFTKVAGLFHDADGLPYTARDFYPLVAFYNYLPDVFRVQQRVEKEQWRNPDAQQFFFRVVDYVKPQRVLITGENLWRALPSRLPGQHGTKRVNDDGSGLFVPFGGDDRECCWYSVEGGEDCLIGAITHPSTRKFNQNRAEICRWIQRFMTWTTRVPPTVPGANA